MIQVTFLNVCIKFMHLDLYKCVNFIHLYIKCIKFTHDCNHSSPENANQQNLRLRYFLQNNISGLNPVKDFCCMSSHLLSLHFTVQLYYTINRRRKCPDTMDSNSDYQ